MFSCEFWEIFKNAVFTEHLPTITCKFTKKGHGNAHFIILFFTAEQ